MISKSLFEKYDVPVPRYTSYPTVPYWSDSPSSEQWLGELQKTFQNPKTTWSMYLHLPFCETLCTYCGCNTIITKDHGREAGYIDLIHKEWATYLEKIPEFAKAPIREIHLGGGTPTFLSPESLEKLLKPILAKVSKDPIQFTGAIEVDPRKTQKEHLEVLRRFGFNRISLGVQDFNEEVQRLVNRIQPFEMTKKITDEARALGFDSVNFDLIYGLPQQTQERMRNSIELTLKLRPDRIALYSLAIVPWIKPAQRIFKDEDLPNPTEKRALYELARKLLVEGGYVEIGMDHFALPNDRLCVVSNNGELHRNFMGYTDQRTDVLLGMGVSAISEAPTCFHQNEKVFTSYERKILDGTLPTLRGHLLNEEDRYYREKILKLITQFEVALDPKETADIQEFLKPMMEDGLVNIEGAFLKITKEGRPFLRNICMAFDLRLRRNQPQSKVFSQAI